ncbi:gephyrin-like molybdotransferase receptor GlpR [Streptomyces sp. HUAS MG91]|uniref:Gephyrin-like molybdotransferase receptor GlpR n=1 Tax=Streptomyces tabacisoli TaxID=3156398 RepID=A0AAU8ITY6_9ACTN
MSSSGLIYAVIVGAWAAYLVPMWLRRQDELNEARPTERFSTAIRLLSGRAGMERRYAKDLQARSPEDERRGDPVDPDAPTDPVDVRAFVTPSAGDRPPAVTERPPADDRPPATHRPPAAQRPAPAQRPPAPGRDHPEPVREPAPETAKSRAARAASAEAQARARRSKVLARRRRTTVMLFLAFTVGAVVAGVGGIAFLWAPAAPALLLSAYIVYLRAQERRRFAYVMDRRRAEIAAQRLRERQPRRRQPATGRATGEYAQYAEYADTAEDGPDAAESATDPGLEALAADRRALVEQTDHAEWVDQQRERQRHPGSGDSWDPVPVPLPTYVTAPVAPRAGGGIDYGAPETWSAARSSPVEEEHAEEQPAADDGRSDARRAASARRSRERGRTPLFDQYDDGADGRPRAANE